MSDKIFVIIPAAGSGQRMGTATIPKQYLRIADKTILEHSLNTFIHQPKITKIIVGLAADDQHWQQLSLASHSKIQTVLGATQRSHTVFNALCALQTMAKSDDWVLVHDAVRPCLHAADLLNLITQCHSHPVGGILATPVRDTLKSCNENNEIVATVPRQQLWQALTPQMFRFELLFLALKKVITHDISITDDAEAIEYSGLKPLVIKGHNDNIKITYPEDIAFAEYRLTKA